MYAQRMAARQVARTIPAQILASKVLQMALPELQTFVEHQVIENPALVVEESNCCPVCGAVISDGNRCQICGLSSEAVSPDEFGEYDRTPGAAYDNDYHDPLGSVAAGTDLQFHLHGQAAVTFEGHSLLVADYIIDSVDERGYFTEPLLETAELFGVSVPQLREILDGVQRLDPPGIAATSVQECLLIQLRQRDGLPAAGEIAMRIIDECWDELSRLKHEPIADKLGVSMDDVKAAVDFIGNELTPYPASQFRAPWQELAPSLVPKIVPDVVIQETRECLGVEVVDFRLGMLKIDELYAVAHSQIRESENSFSDEERKHICEQVNKATCVLDAISLRKANLARLSLYLVEQQKDFVLKGREHLKPMTRKQVAQALDLPESTLSRAANEKYVQLPSGEVIPYDMFFDSALPVKEKILRIVAAPSVSGQLTDGEIAAQLAEQGIRIARRTVAKYRQQLRVPACQLRAA